MSPITPKPNNQELHKNHIKLLTPPTNTRWGNGVNKITAPIVFIFLLFSAIPTLAAQFQPIKEITEFEKEIISNASKKPAEEVLKDAVEFRIGRGFIVLKFQNNDEGYYAYGEKISNAPKTADTNPNALRDYYDEQANSVQEKIQYMLKEELVNALNASPNDEINLKYIMNRLDDEVRNRMLLEEKIELAKFLEKLPPNKDILEGEVSVLASIFETYDLADQIKIDFSQRLFTILNLPELKIIYDNQTDYGSITIHKNGYGTSLHHTLLKIHQMYRDIQKIADENTNLVPFVTYEEILKLFASRGVEIIIEY